MHKNVTFVRINFKEIKCLKLRTKIINLSTKHENILHCLEFIKKLLNIASQTQPQQRK